MSIDMYKTFSPIKQSAFTLVMAIVELTALIMEVNVDKIRSLDPDAWHTSRGCVVETILDLLDLYTQFQKSTKVGGQFVLDKFIDVKIKINKEVEASDGRLSRFEMLCDKCETEDRDSHPVTPGSATSPATTGSYPGSNSVKRSAKGNESTMRFVFDAEQARIEQDTVSSFYKEEYEEYEVEVEEPIPQQGSNNHHSNHHQGRNNNRHGQGHNDHGWQPYHRNRHGHHNDRPKGRKGHGGGYY
jgi:CTD kinase subunit beta